MTARLRSRTRRLGAGAVVANPVLVGAVTMLVVVVACFLAYNANNGLPFVPTRTVDLEFASGAEVTPGVEVREGGYRIGVVDSMAARRLSDGRTGAVLRVKLDQSAGALPVDSRAVIRPRSALALKIVEIERGRSRRVVPEGGRLPVARTRINTDFDELFTLYDEPTREGARDNLVGGGNALAGRGVSLGRTFEQLPGLFGVLSPVMRNLGSEETRLTRFFDELGDTARVVAPVSRELARGFASQADTYEAISRDPRALRQTIERGAPTSDAAIRSFREQRPFLVETRLLSEELAGVAAELPTALPPLNAALETGTPVTRRTVELSDELRGSLAALGDLARAPTTNAALRGLTATVTTLQPTLRFVGPFITVCNYWTMFWTFNAGHFNSPTPVGQAQRVLLNNGDRQNDSVASTMGANEYATGKGTGPNPNAIRQYAHNNVYNGQAIERDGTAECSVGQQGYAYGANKDGVQGYERAVMDQDNGLPNSPVRLGPTFDRFDGQGRGVGVRPSRIPEGQTFTVTPGGRGLRTQWDELMERRR